MKTIKLTNVESELNIKLLSNEMIEEIGYSVIDGMNSEEYVVSIYNVDKFKELLNNEIKALPRPLNEPSRKQYNLYKNIISKLL